MSYTIPDYVDTKEQAVLALASTIKGEAVTGGDGSVNRALDILADVLAEQDVQVPQTDAGAILALAQYASGMVKPEGTIAITENGEGIDVAQYATADVSVSGGGGGDLTTATVTLNRAEGFLSSLNIQCACITNDAGMLDSTNSTVYSEESSVEFTAVLYKGKAIAYPTSEGVALSITGDATYDSDLEVYIITGDCTFTFADA